MADGDLRSGPTPGWVPVPDPTTLTNELVKAAVTGAVDILEAKLAGSRAFYMEKFASVDMRFVELNVRLSEADRYKDTALSTALAANRESLRKTEELFGKQIDSLQKTVDDLKGTVREGAGASTGTGTAIAWVVAGVTTLAAVALVIVDVLHK